MKRQKAVVAEPAFTYSAMLMRCVDGDTVYLEVDLGFRVSGHFEFRLARINAPEMSTPEGLSAQDFLLKMLAGKKLLVQSKKGDNYGRWLGEIFVSDGKSGWMNANDEMVAQGYAVKYTGGKI